MSLYKYDFFFFNDLVKANLRRVHKNYVYLLCFFKKMVNHVGKAVLSERLFRSEWMCCLANLVYK